jgi:hypothetical protein
MYKNVMAWERKHYLKYNYLGGVYQENHRPAASLTDFIRNGVSSNKGVLIADIYIRTTVYINLKNIPPTMALNTTTPPNLSPPFLNEQ